MGKLYVWLIKNIKYEIMPFEYLTLVLYVEILKKNSNRFESASLKFYEQYSLYLLFRN